MPIDLSRCVCGQVSADGFIAAAFRHRTSRAADPHLHTHALVPNMVRSTDAGRWRTLDARHLYPTHLPPGTSTSRTSVTNSPDDSAYAWGPIVNGIADIEERWFTIGSGRTGHRIWKELGIGSGNRIR